MARECTLSNREAKRSFQKLSPMLIENGSHSHNLKDPDTLHDLRVACLRSRVYLAEFRDNVSASARRKARKSLRKIRRRLSVARELDVLLRLVQAWPADDTQCAARDYATAHLAAAREEAQARVEEAGDLLATGVVRDALVRAQDSFEPSAACHLRHARARLRARLADAREVYDTWWTSRLDEDLHSLRVKFKSFRYAVEIYRGLYGKPANEFLETLEAAQDSLGHWNDLRCLRDRVTQAVPDAPAADREGVERLASAIGAEADAARENVREELSAFFDKDLLKEHRELFGDWSRKCCRGAR